MRILLVSDVDPLRVIGGGERLLAGHARGLTARGHDIVICSGTHGPSGDHAGVSIVRVGRSVATPRRISRVVRRFDPDIVIGYQPASALGALRAARLRRIPTAYVFLSPWPKEYATRRRRPLRHGARIRWALEHICLTSSDRIVVLSGYSASELQLAHPGIRSPIRTVPGGVDPNQFSPNGGWEEARRRLGLSFEGPLLLAVRNLVARMGLDSLIAAMPRVLTGVPTAHLVIAGEGPMREALEAQARGLGLSGRISFAGRVPEEQLADYYRAADLAVLPTREMEGFGLMTVEALACGTPVVGTPVGATPEILSPLHPGLVAGDSTPESIAAAVLANLNRDPGDLFERCRQHVLTRYTWASAGAALEAVIEEAVA